MPLAYRMFLRPRVQPEPSHWQLQEDPAAILHGSAAERVNDRFFSQRRWELRKALKIVTQRLQNTEHRSQCRRPSTGIMLAIGALTSLQQILLLVRIDTYTLLRAGIFKALLLDVSDFLRHTIFAISAIS